MLQENGRRWFAPERKNGSVRSFLQPDRLGNAGDLGACNLCPAQHQRGIGKAYLAKHLSCFLLRVVGQRAGKSAPWMIFESPLRMAVFRASHLIMAVRSQSHHSAGSRGKQPGALLLTWYDGHRRELPWRAKPGAIAEPYRVWLSEIMLQQTTVTAVAPYYCEFLNRWPDVRCTCQSAA